MAVDLDAAALRSYLGDDHLSEDRAGELLEVAKARVEGFAPDAPTALQNEAVRRFAGYLNLSGSGTEKGSGFGVMRTLKVGDADTVVQINHAPAFRNSGAEALISPYKVRRGGLI